MNICLDKHRSLRAGFAGLSALSLAGAALLAAPPAAHAQAPGGGKTVTISLQNAPVQTVLRSLFKSAGQNFTIDPAVTGSVNVDVNGVSFQQALDAILSGTNPPLQAPLVNGIYQVGVQQAQPAAPPANGGAAGAAGGATPSTATDPHHAYRIPISHYDAAYMSYLVAAFSIKGGAPIIVPSDPTSQEQGNSQGGGYGGGGGYGQQGGGFGGGGFGGGGFGGGGFGGGGFGGQQGGFGGGFGGQQGGFGGGGFGGNGFGGGGFGGGGFGGGGYGGGGYGGRGF